MALRQIARRTAPKSREASPRFKRVVPTSRRDESAPTAHVAQGQVDETTPARRDKANYQWGLVANLAARVDAEAPGTQRFPGLIVAASLSLPTMGVAEEGAKLLAAAASFGLEPGLADADMQYFANVLPDRPSNAATPRRPTYGRTDSA